MPAVLAWTEAACRVYNKALKSGSLCRYRIIAQAGKDGNKMSLTPLTFLIVCPLVFVAGLVDAIGGGGGLISLPAFLFAGLPVHLAVGTNKLSSACGTTLATVRFARKKMINWSLALPTIAAAVIGSSLGAHISLRLDERVMLIILLAILPLVAFAVLNKHILKDIGKEHERITRRSYISATLAAFAVGMYDGLYGPGTGTFLIVLLTIFSKLSMATANGQTKAINLTSNLTSLVIFLMNGTVLIPLGAAAALCNMLGAYIGSGMVMEKGSKIVRPIMLAVLVLLFLKVVSELL